MNYCQEEYCGPIELLDRDLVAFFASRTSTEDARKKALKWAEEVSHKDIIVISGFHSPLEREVLDILLKNGASVIVGLGRGLYSKIPTHLQKAFDEGRVLFISFRKYSRHSFSSAQIRNWAIAQTAAKLIFAPFESGSSLDVLYQIYNDGVKSGAILD